MKWGDDNLFPNALALMARRSVTHRRIINDKADYISGKGFSCDEGLGKRLSSPQRQNLSLWTLPAPDVIYGSSARLATATAGLNFCFLLMLLVL